MMATHDHQFDDREAPSGFGVGVHDEKSPSIVEYRAGIKNKEQ